MKTLTKDPVCWMDVDPAQAGGRVSYQGKTYQFCSYECEVRFKRSPEDYMETQAPGPNERSPKPENL